MDPNVVKRKVRLHLSRVESLPVGLMHDIVGAREGELVLAVRLQQLPADMVRVQMGEEDHLHVLWMNPHCLEFVEESKCLSDGMGLLPQDCHGGPGWSQTRV